MLDPFLTILNETPEGGAAPEPPAPEPQQQPEPPPEPWGGPSEDEWKQVLQFQQQAAPVLQDLANILQGGQQPQQQPEPQYPQQQQPQQPTFDPFDPQSVQSYINEVAQQQAQQILEPYMGVLGLTASQTGEQLARQQLEGLQNELGQFDTDAALMVASGMLDQGVEPEAALRQAAQYVSEFEKRIRGTAQQEFGQTTVEPRLPQNQPGGQPPGGAPASEIERVPTGPGRYEAVVERWAANRRPQMPVG